MVQQETTRPPTSSELVKIAILRSFLRSYFALTLQHGPGSPDVDAPGRTAAALYVDGAAGPGSYPGRDEGEKLDGPPLIALQAALEASAAPAETAPAETGHAETGHAETGHAETGHAHAGMLHFAFIEKSAALLKKLEQRLERYERHAGIAMHCLHDDFPRGIHNVATGLPRAFRSPVPLFVTLDALATHGVPIEIPGRLLQRPAAELLIAFDQADLRRHISAIAASAGDTDHSHADTGHDEDHSLRRALPPLQKHEWRSLPALKEADAMALLLDRYAAWLRSHGARYAWPFALRDSGDGPVHHFIFAGHDPRLLAQLKKTVRELAAAGCYAFLDPLLHPDECDGQGRLFQEQDHVFTPTVPTYLDPAPYAAAWPDQLCGESRTLEELRDIARDRTPFDDPTPILAEIERRNPRAFRVECPAGRQHLAGDFSDATVRAVHFAPPAWAAQDIPHDVS